MKGNKSSAKKKLISQPSVEEESKGPSANLQQAIDSEVLDAIQAIELQN